MFQQDCQTIPPTCSSGRELSRLTHRQLRLLGVPISELRPCKCSELLYTVVFKENVWITALHNVSEATTHLESQIRMKR